MVVIKKTFNFTEDDVARLKALAEHWGPVEPLSETGAIREALRRTMVAEGLEPEAPKKKRGTAR